VVPTHETIDLGDWNCAYEPVGRNELLESQMLKTFTQSRREYILIAAIVLATVAVVLIPFAWDTAASVQYLESRGLTPSTNPVDATSATVVFAAIACILLLATSGLLLTLSRAAARRIAIIGAGAETVILLGLGAASLVSAYTLRPNSDALGGLALLVISSPLLAGGIAYLAVTLLIRSQRPGCRIAAAILDSVFAGMIALLALHTAINASMPFWAGTVRNPIYNPAPNGTWPLVEAALLALFLLAGAVAVDVYAVRARKPAAGGAIG
jgi:hypothetical protein